MKGTYLLWYIWIQRRRRVPIQTFIWNRVYRKVLTDYMYGKSYLSQDCDTTNKKSAFTSLENEKKYLKRLNLRNVRWKNVLKRSKKRQIHLKNHKKWEKWRSGKLRNVNKRRWKRQIRVDEKFSCHHQKFCWKHELTRETSQKFKSSYSQVNSAQKTKLSFWGN